MGTLVGTPPNLVAVGVLESAGIEVGFVEWMYYGVPLAAMLTAIGWALLVVVYLKDNVPVSCDFLMRDEIEPTREFHAQRGITVAVLIATVLMWMTSEWHNVSVSAVSAIPIVFLTMTRIIQGSDIRNLSWDTLLLVAGGMSLGIALEETGLLKHYAGLVAGLAVSQWVLMGIIAYATMALSNVASNTATATVLVPLGMAMLPDAQLEIALIVGLAASTSVLLPVSNLPTSIAYSTGLVEAKDVMIAGVAIAVLGPALVILWVLLLN
jgi:sodium-dependent dicarboxylate transporter 2/3/5